LRVSALVRCGIAHAATTTDPTAEHAAAAILDASAACALGLAAGRSAGKGARVEANASAVHSAARAATRWASTWTAAARSASTGSATGIAERTSVVAATPAAVSFETRPPARVYAVQLARTAGEAKRVACREQQHSDRSRTMRSREHEAPRKYNPSAKHGWFESTDFRLRTVHEIDARSYRIGGTVMRSRSAPPGYM
jgi:hypothetical protein